MFAKIMAPVDLAHEVALNRALEVAADMARHYGAELCFVAVTAAAPGPLGHTPEEAAAELAAFAERQATAHGLRATSHLSVSHDPAVDLNTTLLDTIAEVGADLVVMASHVPGWADIFTGSHGGWLAGHAPVSVMVVREG